MEYRTAHGKVVQRIERKKQEMARKRTKGKLIVSNHIIYTIGCTVMKSVDTVNNQSMAKWCFLVVESPQEAKDMESTFTQ